jgi:hypothetical protein
VALVVGPCLYYLDRPFNACPAMAAIEPAMHATRSMYVVASMRAGTHASLLPAASNRCILAAPLFSLPHTAARRARVESMVRSFTH